MNHFNIHSEALAIREEVVQKFPEYVMLRGIRIRVSNAMSTAVGSCRYRGGLAFEIVLSFAAFKHDANRAELRDTVLHEIAHAIAGKRAGHGPTWKAVARKVGAKPVRCVTNIPVDPRQIVALACSVCKEPMNATPRQAARARKGVRYHHRKCAPRVPRISFDFFKP